MASTTITNVHVRWMIHRDLPEVLAIERACFTRPWGERDFLAALAERNQIGMVAETKSGTVVGYSLYRLEKPTIHVLNFAVHPRYHRQGIGRQMAAKLVGKLGGRRRRIELRVHDTDLGTHLFWRALGFRAVAVERAVYQDGCDAYVFEYQV
jgi:ribosomal-protein-alanine N-acetyltransferase